MKALRIIARILVIGGSVLLFFSLVLAAMSMYNSIYGVGSMGIIGGVDAVTVWTVFWNRLIGKYASLTITALVSIVISIILFIVMKCSKKCGEKDEKAENS